MKFYFYTILSLCLISSFCSSNKASLYPKNSKVAVWVVDKSKSQKDFTSLRETLCKRLEAFSAEKQDFVVLPNTIKNESDIPGEATHVLTVEIDSLFLCDFNNYVAKYRKVDEEVDANLKVIGVTSEVERRVHGRTGSPIGMMIKGAAGNAAGKKMKENSMKPRMCARFWVNHISKKASQEQHKEVVQTESYKPINEKEQLYQLLTILQGKIEEYIAFFKLEDQ